MTRAEGKRPGLDRGALLWAVAHRDEGKTAISTAPGVQGQQAIQNAAAFALAQAAALKASL